MKQTNLPTKAEIFDYWKERLPQLGIFVDWGEPGCWACGFHYDAKYDIKRPDAPWEEVLSCWDKIPLQRCHIVPCSLGGSNGPENLFLMCAECHDLAPNTVIPDIFFEWAKNQSWYIRESDKLNQAVEAFKLTSEEKNAVTGLVDNQEFRAWVTNKTGLHWPQSGYPSKSSRLTYSTIVGLAKYYLHHKTSFYLTVKGRSDNAE